MPAWAKYEQWHIDGHNPNACHHNRGYSCRADTGHIQESVDPSPSSRNPSLCKCVRMAAYNEITGELYHDNAMPGTNVECWRCPARFTTQDIEEAWFVIRCRHCAYWQRIPNIERAKEQEKKRRYAQWQSLRPKREMASQRYWKTKYGPIIGIQMSKTRLLISELEREMNERRG